MFSVCPCSQFAHVLSLNNQKPGARLLANKTRKRYPVTRGGSALAESYPPIRAASSIPFRSARSLYEAVAQALRIFREDAWCEDLWQSAASLVVKISQPAVEHQVRIKDFPSWLDSAGKSPAEMSLKSRLRDIVSK
jgi:hypothetical protein